MTNALYSIPADFLAKLLFFNGKEDQMTLAISSLERDQVDVILSRYSEREEWVHITASVVTIHNVPLSRLILLARSPSAVISGLPSTVGIYHLFLWQARYSLVSACAVINSPPPFRFTSEFHNPVSPDPLQFIAPHKQEELLEICLFAKSALFALVENGACQPIWYRAICCQIAFEIGNYYWLIDDLAQTIEMMEFCRELIDSFNINLDDFESARDWIEFDLVQLEKIIDVCNALMGKSEESLFSKMSSYLKTKQYQEPAFIMILLNDFVVQEVPLSFKRVLLQDAIKEKAATIPVIALIIALCVSTNTLTMKSDSKEFQEFQKDKTSTRIGKIRRELLPIDTKIMLDLLETARERIPIEILDDWTLIWQVISFTEILESEEKQIQFATHPFLQSFLLQHKDLLLSSVREDSDQAAVQDRSKQSNSFPCFLREMLFTKIRPGEVQYLPNLTYLASEKGIVIIPQLLKLAKKHVTTEPLISLQLLDICQKIPNPAFSAIPGYTYEEFLGELTCIQRDAVVCGLVERAEEFVHDSEVIRKIISQFLTSEDLMTPSSLLLFSKSLKVMITASTIDSAVIYTNNVFTRVGVTNPVLAKAMFVLGNSVSLLFQVEANLIAQGVLVPGEVSIDLNTLNCLENEPVSQYSLLTLQLLTWLCKDLMDINSVVGLAPELQDLVSLQSTVFEEIIHFLKDKDRHPGMAMFIFGCLGGRVSRHLSKDMMLNAELLGPAVVFSFPFKGFSDIPNSDTEPPNEILTRLDQLLLRVRHASETLSHEMIQGGLRLLKLMIDDRIKSVDLEEKRVNEYYMQGDIAFALGDYSSAIRSYLNEILIGGQFGGHLELMRPYRMGAFFKKLAATLVFLKDTISAAFFLQFVLPSPPYKKIFSYLSGSISHLSGSISNDEVVHDPPWKLNASPVYSFFDIHVIEFLISTLHQTGKDDKIVKMLIARLKGPLFDPHDASSMPYYISHVLNWSIQRLCTKWTQSGVKMGV